MENLSHFLSTGGFESIPWRMPQADLLSQLGQTQDFLTFSRKDPRKSLLKYGIVEFYFDGTAENRLHGIMLQPQSQPSAWLSLQMNLEWLKAGLPYVEVKKQLFASNIPFLEKEDTFQQEIIETHSGIIFYFSDEERAKSNWPIQKLGRFIT